MPWIVWILLSIATLGDSIKVKLVVPKFVKSGSTAILVCQYNLEGKKLYSVKWYRGNHEFFRYIPRDIPPMKSFHLHGINVDLLGSSAHQVTLLNVSKYIGGIISCEVSSDDTFSTATDSANLTVTDIRRPVLIIANNLLYPDVPFQINCSAQVTDPLPTITFYVENEKVEAKCMQQLGPGLVSLTLPKAYLNKLDNSIYTSPIRIRCEASVRESYNLSSSSIPIIPQTVLGEVSSAHSDLNKALLITLLAVFITL
ncbi:uncharacterized protein LOC106667795 [Cimex lectularius]|uniref:Ig-like domain-containing protein n=1 Tax=Cimex lectularius TaxID=79782 RepID=A0A8I6TIA0_CIMLE|nr:uncharacterized protein LOC106667795 [Cimex lectularius]XP_024082329.1 uncharacterized protein LOC106667795 [Cimex lectularius]